MTNQIQAPERIWASHRNGKTTTILQGHSNTKIEGWTEYVRADLHDALAKERDEFLLEVMSLNVRLNAASRMGSEPQARAEKAEAEVERLREVLADVAQTLDWQSHGCCRGWSENLLSSSEALARARAALQRKEGNE